MNGLARRSVILFASEGIIMAAQKIQTASENTNRTSSVLEAHILTRTVAATATATAAGERLAAQYLRRWML